MNEKCDMFQGLIFHGYCCQLCGHLLRKASVAACCFRIEDEKNGL